MDWKVLEPLPSTKAQWIYLIATIVPKMDEASNADVLFHPLLGHAMIGT